MVTTFSFRNRNCRPVASPYLCHQVNQVKIGQLSPRLCWIIKLTNIIFRIFQICNWYQCDQIWFNFTTLIRFKSILRSNQCLCGIWQNIEPGLFIFYSIGQIFIVANDQKQNKLVSHPVTLTGITQERYYGFSTSDTPIKIL